MEEKNNDKILTEETLAEYDVAYPVVITRWEIRQVCGLDKKYLKVYFQKISNRTKGIQLDIVYLSATGEEVELTGISIPDVDRRGIEFSWITPVNSETQQVKIDIRQCLLTDDTVIKSDFKIAAEDNFKFFSEEDRAAAEQLLPNAKGYPREYGTHWYCACGKLNAQTNEACIRCKRKKDEVFAAFVDERIHERAAKNRKKHKIFAALVGGSFAILCGLALALEVVLILL